MSAQVSLSEAKTHLSEVVRRVRSHGEELVITVDGEAAARLVPMSSTPRALTSAETASFRAHMAALGRIPRPTAEFDAVELIGEGRR